MRKTIVLMLAVAIIASMPGCSLVEQINTAAAVPEDVINYRTSNVITDVDGEIIKVYPTDFTLLETKVNVEILCAGNVCTSLTKGYYIKFWYVPLQTDYFTGDYLEAGRTTDVATLSKPLYHCNGGDYLGNIFNIQCLDDKRHVIDCGCQPGAVSYNHETRELTIDGFNAESQVNFSVTYFHNQPGDFRVYYDKPNSISGGYVYDERAVGWVVIPEPVQTVQPFAVRCAPVVLEIPEGVELPDGYQFEFWVAVSEGGSDSGGSMQSVRAYQQRWLVSCKQREVHD